MRTALFALVLSTVLLICGAAAAQTTSTEPSADKEKAKKELEKRIVEMLDQAIGEAVTLKSPHNRAIVYALARDMMWKFDEKRAGDLFRRAGRNTYCKCRIRKR